MENVMENHRVKQGLPSACGSEYCADVPCPSECLLSCDGASACQEFDECCEKTGNYYLDNTCLIQPQGCRDDDCPPAANGSLDPFTSAFDLANKMNQQQQQLEIWIKNGVGPDFEGSYGASSSYGTTPSSGSFSTNEFSLPLRQSISTYYDQNSGTSKRNSQVHLAAYNADGSYGYMPNITDLAYVHPQCQWIIPGQACDVSVPNISALGSHVYTDHIQPQTVDRCPYVDCTENVEPRQVTTHVSHNHQEALGVICVFSDCGQWFESVENYKRHSMIVHNGGFLCRWAGCEKTTMSPNQLESHLANDHFPHPPLQSLKTAVPDDFLGSTDSSPPTSVPDQLAGDHVCMWEVEIDPYNRYLCGEQHPDGNALQHHVETVHCKERGAVVCDWRGCKRNRDPLKTKEKLKRHIFSHTGYWTCSCKYPRCGKTFNSKEALDVHQRTHTGEKPFKCTICQQGFAADSALTNHMRIHTGDKKFACENCDFACTDGSNFTKHKLIHGPPQHICDICRKGFHRSSGLDRHMRVHDKNRPDRRKRRILSRLQQA